MPTSIIKYFYEEPVHLEALSAETDPDARRRAAPELSLDALLNPTSYYRGYLAGSVRNHVGLTAITETEAFVVPLLDVFGEVRWTTVQSSGEIKEADPATVLCDPFDVSVLVGAVAEADAADLRTVATEERRYAVSALTRLLDAGVTVLFPEPAHDGYDWSLFSSTPMKDRLVTAFLSHPVEDVRRFVLPYQQARSEHKFYFERWALDALPDYVEEVE